MANANQLKALLQSHIEGDDSRFYSVAMQQAEQNLELGEAAKKQPSTAAAYWIACPKT